MLRWTLASTRLLPVLLPVLARSISSGQNHRDWTANGIWMYLTSMSSEQHHLGWTDQTSMAALVRWLPMLWAALAKSVFSRQNAHDFSTQSSTISSTRSHPMLLSVLAKSMSPDRTIATGQASAVGVYLHDYFQCYDQRLRKMCSPDRTLVTFQARAAQGHPQCLRNMCPPDRTIATGQASAVWLYLHDHFQYYDQRLREVCSPDRTLATFQVRAVQCGYTITSNTIVSACETYVLQTEPSRVERLAEYGCTYMITFNTMNSACEKCVLQTERSRLSILLSMLYEQRLRKVCSPTRLLPILLSMLAKYMSSGQNHREWRAWRSMVEITWSLSILWSALAKSVRWTSSLAKALLQVVCSMLI